MAVLNYIVPGGGWIFLAVSSERKFTELPGIEHHSGPLSLKFNQESNCVYKYLYILYIKYLIT